MAVLANVIYDGPRLMQVLFNNDDGTSNESAVTKVDRDATSHAAGVAAGSSHVVPNKTLDRLLIRDIQYTIEGFDTVELQWLFNAGAEKIISLGTGEGFKEWIHLAPGTSRNTAQATDGDIQFSTEGTAGATSNYSVTITFVKKYVDRE